MTCVIAVIRVRQDEGAQCSLPENEGGVAYMDDEHPVRSPAPEATAEEGVTTTQESTEAAQAGADAEVGTQPETEAGSEADAAAQENGLPHGSIAAVGERLGQRVAQVGEAAGDKVTHASEAAADRVHHVGEVAGQKVAHAGEAAGQRVILAGEAAEGTVAEAQTRAAHATRRIAEQAGRLTGRIRRSAPAPVRERGARTVEAVRKNPRKVFAGSALVGLMAAIRLRGKRSGGDH